MRQIPSLFSQLEWFFLLGFAIGELQETRGCDSVPCQIHYSELIFKDA